jgi:hypothetical protein
MHHIQLLEVTSQLTANLLPPAARQRWLSIESYQLQIQRAAYHRRATRRSSEPKHRSPYFRHFLLNDKSIVIQGSRL